MRAFLKKIVLSFELVTELPEWLFLLCLAAGFACAFILYRKDSAFEEIHIWLKRSLFVFRFLVVSLLAFLLLSPLVKTQLRNVEKPVLIFAQDNSQSVIHNRDSAFVKNEFRESFTSLAKDLKEKYDVKEVSFGSEVKEGLGFSFGDKKTNISNLLEQLSVQYSNRNVGAIVIATDGIFNEGSNPLYASGGLRAPFYCIALGDTQVRKDLVLSRVIHNRVAILGNNFPLQAVADARQLAGSRTKLTVEEDSVVLFEKVIDISGSRFHRNIPVYLDAKTKGIHRYRVSLLPLEGEVTAANNRTEIFVEVLENRQRILLLAHAPHPDIAVLKDAIESNQNYEVKIEMAKDFAGEVNNFNLCILHQVPSVQNTCTPLLEKINSSAVPAWYILGAQSSLSAFNSIGAGLSVTEGKGKMNEAQPSVAHGFSLFMISDAFAKTIGSYPPLSSPFGIYRSNADAYPMLAQKINGTESGIPLMQFSASGNRRTGILAGEGLWRWRLRNFSDAQSHDIVNEFIVKSVQYLSVREEKKPFRIAGKNNFTESEPVVFDAELYNEAEELVNTPEVSMTITNSKGEAYPFTFSKTEKAYTLNAGVFPSGLYKYTAFAKLGDKNYSQSGQFTVSELQAELSETIADHQLLNFLSVKSGGALVYPRELDRLKSLILKRDDIKPVVYSQLKLTDLVNLKWFFFLLLLFLSAEWFLRKRSGSY